MKAVPFKMGSIPLWIIMLFCVMYSPILASYQFEQFTTNNGLSNNSVSSIIQDQYGFLWLGTYNGLNRYDGYQFKKYPVDPESPKGLTSKTIYALCEDHQGYIWIGTNAGGINRYDQDTEVFYKYLHNPEDNRSISSNTIRTIYKDLENELWVGTDMGLNLYDRVTDQFVRMMLPVGENEDQPHITELYEDHNHILWIGTLNGLFYEDRKDTIFHPQAFHHPQYLHLSMKETHGFVEDEKKNLWFGTYGNGLFKIDSQRKAVAHYAANGHSGSSINNNTITSIIYGPKGKLWICTLGGGLNILNRESGHFEKIGYRTYLPKGLQTDNLLSAYIDKHGILWFGTKGAGLHKYVPLKDQFRALEHDDTHANSIHNNRVNSILKSFDSSLWIGTDSGLDHYTPQNKQFRNYQFSTNTSHHDRRGLNVIRSIAEDDDGLLWLGTAGSGLLKFNPQNGQHQFFQVSDNIGLKHNSIFYVISGKDEKIWIATFKGGLNCYDKKTGQAKAYLKDPLNPQSIGTNSLRSLYQDKSGMIWIGSQDFGLIRFNPESEVFHNLYSDLYEPSALKVVTIQEDANGIIWAGTNNGLLKYDPLEEKLDFFLQDTEIPSNVIQSILFDKGGYLWLSTDNGLLKFHPESGEIQRFTMSDGLSTNQFIPPNAVVDDQGYFYFGTPVKGLIYFDPDEIQYDLIPPRVMITDMNLANKKVDIGKMPDGRQLLNKTISRTKQIKLNYKDDILSFNYVGLHLIAPSENKYAYQLEGFDASWNYVENQRHATYTNLPAGNYIFKVKAANGHDIWSEEEARLHIIVTPPFWQRPAFIAVVILGFVVLIFAYVQIRTASIRIRNKTLEEMNIALNNQITKRKEVELALRDERDYNAGIINGSPVFIFGIDGKGKTIFINPAGEKISGYNNEELHNEDLWRTLCSNDDYVQISNLYSQLSKGNVYDYEMSLICKDKSTRLIAWNFISHLDHEGQIHQIIGFGNDITLRRKNENQIQMALIEKDAMLKEIHHRVKNNLQVMLSLIHLQMRKEGDPKFDKYALELTGRIQSMALIHEQLYKIENMADIEIQGYVHSLVERISSGFAPRNIRIDEKIEELHLSIEQSVPLGLIANELITNSFKHAFPEEQAGLISISLKDKDKMIHFEVKDNGQGSVDEEKFHSPDTLGMELVHILTKQLDGKVMFSLKNGTTVKIVFPKESA